MSHNLKTEGEQFTWKMFMTHSVIDNAGTRGWLKVLVSAGLGVTDENGCCRVPKEVQSLMPCVSKIADVDVMNQGDDDVDVVWTILLKEGVDSFAEKRKAQVPKLIFFHRGFDTKADEIDWTEIDADINNAEQAQPPRRTIQYSADARPRLHVHEQ